MQERDAEGGRGGSSSSYLVSRTIGCRLQQLRSRVIVLVHVCILISDPYSMRDALNGEFVLLQQRHVHWTDLSGGGCWSMQGTSFGPTSCSVHGQLLVRVGKLASLNHRVG